MIVHYRKERETLGIFGKDSAFKITENEITWKQNSIKIEKGYIVSAGLINIVRIPLRHVDTVSISSSGIKDAILPELNIIGKGTVLGTLKVGIDIKDEIQDWLLGKIETQ